MIEDIAPTEDQQALAASAARAFAACRGLPPAEIAARLGADGLLGLLAPSGAGGLGLGVTAAWPVLVEAGRAGLAFPLAEAIVAANVVASADPVLGETFINGSRIVTVCWAPAVRLVGDRVTGVAPRVPLAAAADDVLLIASDATLLVALTADGVEMAEGADLDLDRPYRDVVLRDAVSVLLQSVPAPELTRLGALLRAADMLGAAEAAFEAACAHASTRRQFGKPLSGQQIVAADLARDHFRLDCVRASLAYAAISLEAGQADAADACDIAAALAAADLPGVVENAIQLHGALGFTWDLPLHRSLRRVRTAGDIMPAADLRRMLGQRLIARWEQAA